MTWGVDAHILDRFTSAGIPKENISLAKDTYLFTSPDKSPAEVIDAFRRFYGPTMNAFEAAEKSNKSPDLLAQLLQLAQHFNTRTNNSTAIPSTFLRITVHRPSIS